MLRASPSTLLVLVAALGRSAVAGADLAPDDEVARREFKAGADAYERNAYDEALAHFNAAKQAKAAPAFDYNIGRCLDRLGRWQEAANAYQRFVNEAPTSENVAALRARIVELRLRPAPEPGVVSPTTSPAPTPPGLPKLHLRLIAASVLGGALAVELAASVVYGTAYSDYAAQRKSCGGSCTPNDPQVVSLRSEVHTREIASGVLWGVGSAALVADVVLWSLDARHRTMAHVDAARGIIRF